ncbi:carbonic anhydrase [Ranunculus cassubicifolius]
MMKCSAKTMLPLFLSLISIHLRRTIAQEVEWANCSNGLYQSPIDLSNETATIILGNGNIQINYKPTNATLRNRGHDVMVEWWGDAGSIQVNGTNYTLLQSHWHSPSEHAVDGQRFALEQHLVHKTTDPITGEILMAVIGILYNIGANDDFLSLLEASINITINENQTEVNTGILDPREIYINNNEYYKYMGSLTTPPCKEGVVWIIHKQVGNVSAQQVESLRSAVHDYAENNARPLQPRNNRDIHLHKSANILLV